MTNPLPVIAAAAEEDLVRRIGDELSKFANGGFAVGSTAILISSNRDPGVVRASWNIATTNAPAYANCTYVLDGGTIAISFA